MRVATYISSILFLLIVSSLLGCDMGSARERATEYKVYQTIDTNEITPLPQPSAHIGDEARLGARLFNDPRLSRTREIS